jgi:hypothetical protein
LSGNSSARIDDIFVMKKWWGYPTT